MLSCHVTAEEPILGAALRCSPVTRVAALQATGTFSFLKRIVLSTMAQSQVRQNFHKDCEDAINKQINMELNASYVYMSMAYHFDRDDVALPGLKKYFKSASDEERGHAMKFMEYLNQRGGRIILTDVFAPEKQDWGVAQEAMHSALELEKKVNNSLLSLHSVASGHMDVNLCDFLETHFLQEQVDSIKEIADHVTNLKRVGEGLGVYILDQKFLESE